MDAIALPIDANIVTTLQGWFADNPGAVIASTEVLPDGRLLIIYAG